MYVVLIISFYVSFFSLLLSCLPLPHSSPSSLVTCIRFVTMGRCTTARENPDDPLNPHTLLTQLDEKCPLDLTHLDDNAIVLLIQANCFLPQLRKPKVLWDRAKEIRGLVMQRAATPHVDMPTLGESAVSGPNVSASNRPDSYASKARASARGAWSSKITPLTKRPPSYLSKVVPSSSRPSSRRAVQKEKDTSKKVLSHGTLQQKKLESSKQLPRETLQQEKPESSKQLTRGTAPIV